MIISFLIWNGSPEIFSIGQVSLRWYGLLFALGFLVSQQILYYIHRREGKPEKDVDTLTIYMVIATILGARLGHVIFYQPEIIWTDPLGILLPFEFSPRFRFTGLQGLASHGGAIGILIALWIYCRYSISFSKADVALAGKVSSEGKVQKKFKRGLFIEKRLLPGQSYLQVLDRIAILVALTGAFIRTGNYFNSEIIGKPTNVPWGVVFTSHLTNIVQNKIQTNNPVESVDVLKDSVVVARDTSLASAPGRVPVIVYLFFKQGVSEKDMRLYLNSRMKGYLLDLSNPAIPERWHFEESAMGSLDFMFALQENGTYAVKIKTIGIARHPAQLYEAISCILLFAILFWLWKKEKENTPPGRIFGIFLIILWSLRFFYEFLKENQVGFEAALPINMGQILSIPLFIAGILILIRSYRKPVAVQNRG